MHKWLEQRADGFLGDADSRVTDFKQRDDPAITPTRSTHGDDDFATVSELDGIAGKIDQALANALRITADPFRYVGADVDDQLQVFRSGLKCHRASDVFDMVAQIHVHIIDVELAGFDL